MAPKIKLVYFAIKGRAELPRLILNAANMDFEDKRLQFSEWPELKPKTMFGSLPYLEYDGETIGQSLTIARFLAKKANLMGDSDLDEARISMVVDHISDCFTKMIPLRWGKDKTEKLKGAEEYVEKLLPGYLKILDERLKAFEGDYFVGNKLSLADITVYSYLECITDADDAAFADIDNDVTRKRLTILEDFPALKANFELVKQQDGIKKYLDARPKTNM